MPLQSPDVRLAQSVLGGQVPAGRYGVRVCTCMRACMYVCMYVLVSVEVKGQSLGVFYYSPIFFFFFFF